MNSNGHQNKLLIEQNHLKDQYNSKHTEEAVKLKAESKEKEKTTSHFDVYFTLSLIDFVHLCVCIADL